MKNNITLHNIMSNSTNRFTFIDLIFFFLKNGILMNVKKNEKIHMNSGKLINSFESKKA